MNLDRFSLAVLQEKVASLTPQQRVMLFVGTFRLPGAGILLLAVPAPIGSHGALQTDLAQQRKTAGRAQGRGSQIACAPEELAKAEAEFAHLLSLLPDQREIPALLETVSKLGLRSALKIFFSSPS